MLEPEEIDQERHQVEMACKVKEVERKVAGTSWFLSEKQSHYQRAWTRQRRAGFTAFCRHGQCTSTK